MKISKISILTGLTVLGLTANVDLTLSVYGQDRDVLAPKVKTLAQKTDSITCLVNGTVIDRPEATSALIIEAGKDFRIHPCHNVPITDGKFSLTIKDTKPLAYEVVFDDELKRGSWRIRTFFSGDGGVDLYYNNQEMADNDKVVSNISDNILAERFSQIDKMNFKQQKDRIYSAIDSLYENKAAYTPEYQALLDQFSLSQGEAQDSIREIIYRMNLGPATKVHSKEYLEYETELLGLFSQSDSIKRRFIVENPSLYGLYSIKNAFAYVGSGHDWLDIQAYIDIFNDNYKDTYPHHPYTSEIQSLIDALQVVAGNRYPDYKVTREDGSTEQISSLIKGNVAVIDLWASWCGPCRKHSKELIPLYEKYKEKGFKVVAVARESENCEAMKYAMKQDGYPWESFVDLNDRDKVWQKNQAGNGGGKIILVNSDGVIVGTDIPTEDIKAFLIQTYGE